MTIAIPHGWLRMHFGRVARACVCYRITRKDGVVYRLTDHDRPVWIGSEEFVPMDEDAGAESGNLRRDGSLREHSVPLRGILSDSSITITDIRKGLFSGARVDVIRTDWLYPFAHPQSKSMQITDLRYNTDGAWEAELTSVASLAMRTKFGERSSVTCRNKLFDENCTRCSGYDCNTPTLVRDQWEVGHGSGTKPTVSAVDSSTSTIAFTVSLPRVAIDSIVQVGPNTDFTTAASHFFAGASPPLSGVVPRLPLAVRGNIGHSSGDINGPVRFTFGNSTVLATPDITTGVGGGGSTLGFIQVEPPAGWMDFGEVLWLTGPNAGLTAQIRSQSEFVATNTGNFGGNVQIVLESPMPAAIGVGDTCKLTVGCDKLAATCLDKFKIVSQFVQGNSVNFRGEPSIRSNRSLVRTPGSR